MLGEDSYLIDILDSAQEACPFIWVNGDKYMLGDGVIEKGAQLFATFVKVTNRI